MGNYIVEFKNKDNGELSQYIKVEATTEHDAKIKAIDILLNRMYNINVAEFVGGKNNGAYNT